ncbi:MAG: hypothetical protein QOI24_1390 [Acidobacteriota bacterium]|jgi:hypothetical protein|nr:hypothetical protein [Acidobacteriota bacterium]
MSESIRTAAPAIAPSVNATPLRAPLLARKCACAGSESSCAKCADEETKGGALQRKAAGRAMPGRIPDSVRRVLSSPGRPLDGGVRSSMEARFGHDFSSVRIHTGAAAAESAHAVGAHAYTVGNDIVFASRHDPQSPHGMHILAHELTHTIQQRGVAPASFDELPISAPDHATEREADAVASAVMRGEATRAPSVARHGLAMLSRLSETEPGPSQLEQKEVKLTEIPPTKENPGDKRLRWFRVSRAFPQPSEKGPQGVKLLESKPKLRIVGDTTGGMAAGLKARRSGTRTLKLMWLAALAWPEATTEATKLWKQHGGAGDDFLASAKAGTEVCEFDHIIELQAGGPDIPSNLQAVTGKSNVDSAVQVRAEITDRVKDAVKLAGDPDMQQVGLVYDTVTQAGGTDCGTDICCAIDQCARECARKAKMSRSAPDDTDPYVLKSASFTQTAHVPKDETKEPALLSRSEIPENRFAARLVPGLILDKLSGRNGPTPTIKARIAGDAVPITVTKGEEVTVNVGKDGTLDVKNSKPHIKFTFPHLSEGEITKFEVAPEGLHAFGTIYPSLSLLKGTALDFYLTPDSAGAILKPKKKLTSPIPGLELNNPRLLLPLIPEFKPEGLVDFSIGKNLVTGVLSVTVEGDALVATAKAIAHIPGIDEAEGDVRYHAKDGFSSRIHLSKSGKKFVTNVAVDVFITDAGINAIGTIDVEPPGGSLVKLTIARNEAGEPQYTGHGLINVPGLADPVDVLVGYNAKGLTAKGVAPFSLKALGAKGILGVTYDSNLGFIGSISNFKFQKGLATVTLEHLTLAKEKFTGAGAIEMPVGKSLMAKGAVTLDEKQQLAITAALKIAKPIVLFNAFGGNYNLFTLPAISIPIPGASIAGFGLKLEILGGLSAGYRIGPGTLDEAEISAGVNPLLATSTAGVKLHARLLIPAHASVTGSITGLVALDLLAASVAGGVTVSATASLDGGLDARTDVAYAPERLVIDAKLDAALKLMLTLGLDAVVRASVLGAKYENVWKLGRWPFDPGVYFSIGGQFHYDSTQAFTPPALTFKKPALDGAKLVTGPFSGSSPKETKK